MPPVVDGVAVFMVTAQVGNRFTLNAWDTENIVRFLIPSPKKFAWKLTQNLGGTLNKRWIWETWWGDWLVNP